MYWVLLIHKPINYETYTHHTLSSSSYFFPNYVNRDSVVYCKLEVSYWENILKELINCHIKFTNSMRAKEIIANWTNEKKNFWQVVPMETINQLENPVFSQKKYRFKKEIA